MAQGPRTRGEKISIGFMILWLVFWTAGILIVVWGVGATVLDGDVEAGVVMAVWLVAAGFGLVAGARRLRALLLREAKPRKGVRNHRWDDGFGDGPGGTA